MPAAGELSDRQQSADLAGPEAMSARRAAKVTQWALNDRPFREQRLDPSEITTVAEHGRQQPRFVHDGAILLHICIYV